MMKNSQQKVRQWHDVDSALFRQEIIPRYQPAILKGFANHWPAVRHARNTPQALVNYLMHFDNGTAVDAIMTPPDQRGRVFYNADMSGFNFFRNQITVSTVLEQLSRYACFPTSPAVALQSALISACLPGFLAENTLSLLDTTVAPRIWIGNAIITPAHFDQSSNLACVVSGQRRFTLFPPEQVGNLYIGPLDFAPTPTPISLVDFHAPDEARFPRFKQALQVAQVADLEAGDMLYIPPLWWHHVESFDKLNVLVNYWWHEVPAAAGLSPFECLLQSLQTINHLPAEQKQAWCALFSHYVFNTTENPAAPIPATS